MKPWMWTALLTLVLGAAAGAVVQAWDIGQLGALGLVTVVTLIAGVPILVEEARRSGPEDGRRPRAQH